MFLTKLNDAEKEAFLGLARAFIRSDERVSGAEVELLQQMCAEMGLDPTKELEDRSRAELLAVFESYPAKAACLLELLAMADADSEFGDEERAFVREASSALGIPEDVVQEMCAWQDRRSDLVQAADRFFKVP